MTAAIKQPNRHWLADAVVYQIYPPSFADANADGIGDLAGIEARLDYLQWLGVNTVWINPCFVSPFRDAGYDVADYFTIAPRYGTNDDLARLVDAAGRRGIRLLLDLVPGHTSDEHPWFTASANDPSDHRYIWAETEHRPERFVASPGSRRGWYLPNFYDSQPALNFGYARMAAAERWRQPVDADGPRANRAALRAVIEHWLGLGVAGFRVDMAFSLVKDDPGKTQTCRLWRELRSWLDRRHPHAALLAEWGDPATSAPAGFHADFFLPFGGPTAGRCLRSLWHNGAGTVDERWEPAEPYFGADGVGSPRTFLDGWLAAATAVADAGYIGLPTSSHDFSRLCCGPRTAEQLPAAFTFVLTWPTLPVIYYGDEIGMRYLPGLPDREGALVAGVNRAGCRTPMQWDGTANAGFSAATADRLYLPVDPDPARPTVAAQRADDGSLLRHVRRLIALRGGSPELGGAGDVEVLHASYPLVYLRGGRYLVVVNPRRRPATAAVPVPAVALVRRLGSGVAVEHGRVRTDGFGHGVFELVGEEVRPDPVGQ